MGQITSYARVEVVPRRAEGALYTIIYDSSMELSRRLPPGKLMTIVVDPVTNEPITFLPFSNKRNVFFDWFRFREANEEDDNVSVRCPRFPLFMSLVRFNPQFGCIAALLRAFEGADAAPRGWISTTQCEDELLRMKSDDWLGYDYTSLNEIIGHLDPSEGDRHGAVEHKMTNMIAEKFLGLLCLSRSNGEEAANHTTSRLPKKSDSCCMSLRAYEASLIADLLYQKREDVPTIDQDDLEASGLAKSAHIAFCHDPANPDQSQSVSMDPSCEHSGCINAAKGNSQRENGLKEGRRRKFDFLVVPYLADALKAMLLYVPDDPLSTEEADEVQQVAEEIVDFRFTAVRKMDAINQVSLGRYDWTEFDRNKSSWLAEWHKNFGNWNIPFWTLDLHELITLIIAPIVEFELHLRLDHTMHQYSEALRARTVVKFFKYAIASYNERNYYHSGFHGAQVLHASFMMVRGDYLHGGHPFSDDDGFNILYIAERSPLTSLVTKIDLMALLFGALCHDVDHPMLTNSFLRNMDHPIALHYNDASVLENYHVSFAFQRILSRPESDVRELWSKQEIQSFRKSFIRVILSTDMEFHGQGVIAARDRMLAHQTGEKLLSHYNESDRLFLIEGIIRMADASNPTLPYPSVAMWGTAISEEFILQNISEYEMGIASTHFMRLVARKDKAKMLHDFCSLVVNPLFRSFAPVIPVVWERQKCLEGNMKLWSKVRDYYAKLATYEDALERCTTVAEKEDLYESEGKHLKHFLNLGPYVPSFGEWGSNSMAPDGPDENDEPESMGFWTRYSYLWGLRAVKPPKIDSEDEVEQILKRQRTDPSQAQIAYMPLAYLTPSPGALRARSRTPYGFYPYLHDDITTTKTNINEEIDVDSDSVEDPMDIINPPCDMLVDVTTIFDFAKMFRANRIAGALPSTNRSTDPLHWPVEFDLRDVVYLKSPQPSEIAMRIQRDASKQNSTSNLDRCPHVPICSSDSGHSSLCERGGTFRIPSPRVKNSAFTHYHLRSDQDSTEEGGRQNNCYG